MPIIGEYRKKDIYLLIDRLIYLALTLPVSTTTMKRTFSAIKIVQNRLRSKMEDDFFADYLVIYIEKEMAKNFIVDFIIDEFNSMKKHKT